jgi:hypothetical protein
LVAGILCAALAGGLALLAFRFGLAEAEKATASECASPGPAVEYSGWYGTVHDFVFSNQQYLDAFVALNRQKRMSDIREIA